MRTLGPFLVIIFWVAGLFIFQMIFRPAAVGKVVLRTIRLFIGQALMFSCIGVSFYFLLPEWKGAELLFVVGGFILSYVAGYVAIFAPGGIGIRELVSMAVFSGIASGTELVALTIVHRLLYTLVEFVLGLWGFFISRNQKAVSNLETAVEPVVDAQDLSIEQGDDY
jgi:hypothetical protein